MLGSSFFCRYHDTYTYPCLTHMHARNKIHGCLLLNHTVRSCSFRILIMSIKGVKYQSLVPKCSQFPSNTDGVGTQNGLESPASYKLCKLSFLETCWTNYAKVISPCFPPVWPVGICATQGHEVVQLLDAWYLNGIIQAENWKWLDNSNTIIHVQLCSMFPLDNWKTSCNAISKSVANPMTCNLPHCNFNR